MIDISPQLLAGLAGGLVTALASVSAVMLTGRNQRRLEQARWRRDEQLEAARWKREDQARFHLYRRELYARFLSNVSTAFQGAFVVAQFRGDQVAEQLPQFREQNQLLGQSMAIITTLWEEVSLIGSPEVVSAAKDINGVVATCRLGSYLPAAKAVIEGAQKNYQDAIRPRFLVAARSELGLPTSEIL